MLIIVSFMLLFVRVNNIYILQGNPRPLPVSLVMRLILTPPTGCRTHNAQLKGSPAAVLPSPVLQTQHHRLSLLSIGQLAPMLLAILAVTRHPWLLDHRTIQDVSNKSVLPTVLFVYQPTNLTKDQLLKEMWINHLQLCPCQKMVYRKPCALSILIYRHFFHKLI